MPAFLLLISLILLQSPFLVGTSFATLIAVLVPFWLAIGLRLLDFSQQRLTFPRSGIAPRETRLPVALLVAWALFAVAFARAAMTGAVAAPEAVHQLLFLSTLILFGLVAYGRETTLVRGADYLLWAVGLYLLFNAVMQLAGWKSSVNDDISAGITARMLATVGIFTDRTIFPTAGGLNNFGAVAGLAIAGGIAGTVGGRSAPARAAAAMTAIAGLYIIVRTDSRAGMMFALLAGGLVAILPMRWLRSGRFGVLIIPTLPVALFAIAVLLASLLGTTALIRNPEEVYNLGSRAFIWAAIGAELRTFSPGHLVGFGFFGQTQSTIVQHFGDVVGAGYDTGRLTAHNMLLQLALDIGYLGVIVMLALFWSAFARIDRVPESQRKIVAALLLYLLLAGVTESTPTPYYRECFAIFMLLITFVIASTRRESGRSMVQAGVPDSLI